MNPCLLTAFCFLYSITPIGTANHQSHSVSSQQIHTRMTKRPQTNSKRQPKPTRSFPTTNSANYMIPTVTPASTPMHNSQAIPLKDSKASAALGVATAGSIFIRLEVKRLILRNCLRHSSVWVADEGGIEGPGRDPICKCMSA